MSSSTTMQLPPEHSYPSHARKFTCGRRQYRGSHRCKPNRDGNAGQISVLYEVNDAFDSRSTRTRHDHTKNDTLYKWRRDPLVAEAMVDEQIAIPNLIDTGKVLTFTTQEAQKWGYCDGIAENPDEVITQHLGYKDYEMKTYTPSWQDDLKGF